MLEIDLVKVAIETGPNWELGDELADRYEQAVELATRGRMTDEAFASIAWRLDFLFSHEGYIMRRLEAAESGRPFQGVTEAYRSTLNQILYLAGQQR